eukprot:TRINITY_DN38394_c0_g1_i1.p1 TRINITY_DN38394_c0_g1~~TRINITY_DN38394_c0_g1_i1.p1  ORF type:complete len:305 (-),score=70.58 TRINITY_DN38394_c0_g1_i1:36-950(-)
MLTSLAAFEGMGLFDALAVQELCRLQNLNKSFAGLVGSAYLQWQTTAKRALHGFELSPVLFRSDVLPQFLKLMPSLLEQASARQASCKQEKAQSLPLVRLECLEEAQKLQQRLCTASKQAREHMLGDGRFAKVLITHLRVPAATEAIVACGAPLVIHDVPPAAFKTGGEDSAGTLQTAVSFRLHLARRQGKLLVALRDDAASPLTDNQEGDASIGRQGEFMLDLSSVDPSGLLLHCRSVRMWLNGPFVEARGICSFPSRPADATRGAGSHLCVLCLRDSSGTLKNCSVRRLEALQIDNSNWFRS